MICEHGFLRGENVSVGCCGRYRVNGNTLSSCSGRASFVPSSTDHHADQGIFATVYAPQLPTNPRPVTFVAAPAPPIVQSSSASDPNDPFSMFATIPAVIITSAPAPVVSPLAVSVTASDVAPSASDSLFDENIDVFVFQYNGPSFPDDDLDMENSVISRLLTERDAATEIPPAQAENDCEDNNNSALHF